MQWEEPTNSSIIVAEKLFLPRLYLYVSEKHKTRLVFRTITDIGGAAKQKDGHVFAK
jgi:hypothetical protein